MKKLNFLCSKFSSGCTNCCTFCCKKSLENSTRNTVSTPIYFRGSKVSRFFFSHSNPIFVHAKPSRFPSRSRICHRMSHQNQIFTPKERVQFPQNPSSNEEKEDAFKNGVPLLTCAFVVVPKQFLLRFCVVRSPIISSVFFSYFQ